MKTALKPLIFATILGGVGLSACTHKVQIIPSDKPILINLNVTISQEIRVRLDESVDELLSDNPDIF